MASSNPTDLCAKPCCTLSDQGADGETLKPRARMSYVCGLSSGAPLLKKETFICGPKTELIAALSTSGDLALALPGEAAAHLRAVVQTLKPGKDINHSAKATYQYFGESVPIAVHVCALPTQCSRHNAPAHPHAITDFIRTSAGNRANIDIVLVISDPLHAFSAGVAAARAFPRFSAKAAFGGGEGMGGEGNQVCDYSEGAKHLGTGFESTPKAIAVRFVSPSSEFKPDDANKTVRALSFVAEGVALASRMVDAPTNYMHTDACVAEAEAAFERAKVSSSDDKFRLTIIKGEELKKLGLGLLWGVGKAAVHKPALVILSYSPDGDGNFCGGIAMCGKGIVYDTGGLSIKGKTFMPGMKRDMGGAAAVLAGWEAAVKIGCTSTIHAVMCLAENSVGPESTRPDDVHTGFSGKTVEVVNTDAEGRLALGDGVAYAARYLKPTTIIDAATLTGAQGIATGKRHASIYCSTAESECIAVDAGRFTGDLTHPMPYCPEFYRHEFRSAVADFTNNVKDRSNAQVSCAGQFIGNHLPDGWLDQKGHSWIHIDFAYPAFDKSSERATGFGVALLAALCGTIHGCDGVSH